MHLRQDWHFKCNVRADHQRQAKLSRQWHDPEADWVRLMGGLDLTVAQNTQVVLDEENGGAGAAADADKVHCVPEDEAHSQCCVCNEAFEKFWSVRRRSERKGSDSSF